LPPTRCTRFTAASDFQIASDAGVPGVTVFRVCASKALADVLHAIHHGDAVKILHALVAKLPGDLQANRSAVGCGKVLAVHAVSEKGLWMPGVGHVNALPPLDGALTIGEGKEDNVF